MNKLSDVRELLKELETTDSKKRESELKSKIYPFFNNESSELEQYNLCSECGDEYTIGGCESEEELLAMDECSDSGICGNCEE